ncbi:2-oxo-4-hydroxy-4-carboxy-5-ureidoimidazoline decarboxylase [Enterobacter sp. RHBSTW-00994]|uniref:2-oxo-4-hydroxy-4-carboxy-5-ureidoimidazoline decarboxylase n=1 Tax=Enterobacteriaceae TaxID=543 RepID=UPI0015E9D091|nr:MULTISPECIES: 2-oxo-4-hydroxy-4-carboxy-5-ureidoimidazoline decarboxylase [Enterobacteriaceae]MBM3071234.1 2-oxo-4-hydroxy-4-carboxy-5-ureidoimidazoline decarboxylase [Lelliottia sp. RWM.1]QLR42588.1 2-oxo-4-hydroxy-4-carboxy-5-ureidoimidazoline decarboxylase [Enterobacter sp. RHBSTW-00994]
MIALNDFNRLEHDEAVACLRPCVAIESWSEALADARPFASLSALFDYGHGISLAWDEAALAQALSAHPRIGEKPAGQQTHAAMSRQEQSAVNDCDADLTQSLREGNARYEARFGRVFLIRAKGRSGEAILQALEQRLKNSDAEEVQSALTQLREITLLRLEGVVGE